MENSKEENKVVDINQYRQEHEKPKMPSLRPSESMGRILDFGTGKEIQSQKLREEEGQIGGFETPPDLSDEDYDAVIRNIRDLFVRALNRLGISHAEDIKKNEVFYSLSGYKEKIKHKIIMAKNKQDLENVIKDADAYIEELLKKVS